MAGILISAAIVCLVSLFLGQAALRLAGAREWNWLAPAVGLSVAMLIVAPMEHLPGRATTVAVLLAVLTVAAATWCLRSPPQRPPLLDLLTAAPVFFLALVPFLTSGHGGILGVTVDNDMTVHLAFVEGLIHPAVAEVFPLPSDYPLSPHEMAAALSDGLGITADLAFSGWSMAVLVIGAWTVLAAVRNAAWYGKAIAATVVGVPYLIAAYYGQGSFKELAQAALVLAVVLCVSGCGPRLGRGRWVPLALLTGGVVSAYSPAGLSWVVAIVGLWLAGLLAIQAWRRRLGEVPRAVRRELPALGIGVAVLVLVLLPQAHRMYEFIALREGTGVAVSDTGNLITRLPGWEALGIWNTYDYRLPASSAFLGGAWSWFVVALIVFGAFWSLRRGRWILPLAALAAMLLWKYSDRTQSIYVAAKGLAIASPLLLLVAVQPLVDRDPQRRSRWRRAWPAVPLLALVLLFQVAESDLRVLRFSPVGPTGHARQLMSFRPLIAGKHTLFLSEDEFYIWELVGSEVAPIALGATPQVPLRPEKEWEFGEAADFDTVPASTLNEYEWFITARDAAASEPPPQLRLVRSTEDFELWKRTGKVQERSTLEEGEWPGAVFRCDSREGRAILRRGGVAAIRRSPVVAPLGLVSLGGTITAKLRLPAGSWQLEAPYSSRYDITVTAPGLKAVLPASLDREGPRLPIGQLRLDRPRRVKIAFHVGDSWLAPPSSASIGYVAAIPLGGKDRIVPIGRACGRYVDWYRSARR